MEAAFFDDHHPYEVQEVTHPDSESLELAKRIEEQQILVEKVSNMLELAHDHLANVQARINRGEPVTEDELGDANHEVDRLFAKEADARRKLHKLQVEFAEFDTEGEDSDAH